MALVPAVLAALPSWLEPDRLRTLALIVLAVLVVAAVLVAWIVRQIVAKLVLVAVLAVAAVAVWTQYDELEGCVRTCDCRFFGQDVALPDSARALCERREGVTPP